MPGYFSLLGGDLALAEDRAQTATFETPCFWSGETSLAQFVGVISTDAGWVGGEEVVQVRFDPTHLPPSRACRICPQGRFPRRRQCRFSLDKDPQFTHLQKHKARHLPLTAAQRTRLNVAIPYGDAIDEFLSPHQRAWLADDRLTQVSANDAYRQDFSTTWHQLDRSAACPHERIMTMDITNIGLVDDDDILLDIAALALNQLDHGEADLQPYLAQLDEIEDLVCAEGAARSFRVNAQQFCWK